jgi:hypothetical protein
MQTPTVMHFYNEEISQEDDIPINKAAFCENLKDKIPYIGCHVASPPSTPGLDLNWRPNGCGAGPIDQYLIDRALSIIPSEYSGNIHAPYPGVSFLNACNQHDRCWGIGGNRLTCDENFLTDMRNACSASAGAGIGVCNGVASGYHSVVSSTSIGHGNYNSAVRQRACATWAHDMKSNSCPQY